MRNKLGRLRSAATPSRSTDPAPDPGPQDEPAPARQQPPEGALLVDCAGVFDGSTLWASIALSGPDQRPALRSTRDPEQVVTLPADRLDPDETGGALAGAEHAVAVTVAVDSVVGPAGLPADDEAWDLVVQTAKGHLLPVWVPAADSSDRLVVPAGPRGDTVLSLQRTDAGGLRLRRRPLAPGVRVVDVRTGTPTDAGGVVLELAGGAGSPAFDSSAFDSSALDSVLLVDRDGETVSRVPATATPAGTWQVEVTVHTLDALAGLEPQPLTLVATAGDRRLVVRRDRNGLAAPGKDTLLPELSDGSDRVLRLRWVGPLAELGARLTTGPTG